MARPKIREITEEDLPQVVHLLDEGFDRVTAAYGSTVMDRLARRECPPGLTRFGFALAVGDTLGGLILAIPSLHADGPAPQVLVNLSCWYVQAPFRATGALPLYRHAIGRDDVTYSNLTPSTNTIKLITHVGFTQTTAGQVAVISLTGSGRSSGKARLLSLEQAARVGLSVADETLLADHRDLGCLTACLETPEGLSPLVFLKRRIKGVLPCAQLVYCRDLGPLAAHGAALSAGLWRRGFALLMMDASGPLPGFVGRYVPGKGPRYYKGPPPAAAVDHTYSELVLFPGLI